MSKLFDKKDIFSWSNCEEAKKYIGEKGYFRDDYQADLAAWRQGILQEIDPSLPVDCTFEDEENCAHGLFLPADKVKQQEPKKWRPFKTIDEFKKTLNSINFLDALTFREKHDTSHQYCAVFDGFVDTNGELDRVSLGGKFWTAAELFNHYEWFDDEKTEDWQPFGVEE